MRRRSRNGSRKVIRDFYCAVPRWRRKLFQDVGIRGIANEDSLFCLLKATKIQIGPYVILRAAQNKHA